MIKLILATASMVLTCSVSAQLDTLMKKEYQSMNPNVTYPLNKMSQEKTPYGTYVTGMYHDTTSNRTYSNRMYLDSLFNNGYNKGMTYNGYNSNMYRDTVPQADMKKYKMENMSRGKHVMMQNGKMTMMKRGKMTVLKNYTNLNNGTRAMRDGSIIKKDGSTITLQEGECVNMAGEIMVMPVQ